MTTNLDRKVFSLYASVLRKQICSPSIYSRVDFIFSNNVNVNENINFDYAGCLLLLNINEEIFFDENTDIKMILYMLKYLNDLELTLLLIMIKFPKS